MWAAKKKKSSKAKNKMKQEAVIKSILKILEAAIPWDILTIKPTSQKMRVVIWEEKTLINKIESGNNPKPHRVLWSVLIFSAACPIW